MPDIKSCPFCTPQKQREPKIPDEMENKHITECLLDDGNNHHI